MAALRPLCGGMVCGVATCQEGPEKRYLCVMKDTELEKLFRIFLHAQEGPEKRYLVLPLVEALSGAQGLSRPTGAQALSRLTGAQALSRLTGAQGLSRLTGAQGLSRPTGAQGLSRPTGARLSPAPELRLVSCP